jgi:hypothetical protein
MYADDTVLFSENVHCHPCLINSISISLTYMAYKNGDNDSPCTSPILQLKKSEKLPSCFTLDRLSLVNILKPIQIPPFWCTYII